tara:strand:- start:111 stop:359 length:249 start_codon:yes stop_codon:yes gene_type:complete
VILLGLIFFFISSAPNHLSESGAFLYPHSCNFPQSSSCLTSPIAASIILQQQFSLFASAGIRANASLLEQNKALAQVRTSPA